MLRRSNLPNQRTHSQRLDNRRLLGRPLLRIPIPDPCDYGMLLEFTLRQGNSSGNIDQPHVAASFEIISEGLPGRSVLESIQDGTYSPVISHNFSQNSTTTNSTTTPTFGQHN
jgi:hypothetical protein